MSSLYHLKDSENDNRDAGFFVFPDLSVRQEGSYRLKLSLFEVVGYVIFSHHFIYRPVFSVSCFLFTPIPPPAPYLVRFMCYFTPCHNPFPRPKRCRGSFSFSSVLFTDFFHLSTSRVVHFIHLSDCLWQHWANHLHI